MEKIALPQKMTVLPGNQPNEELIVVEPFFPGYGTTVGNALRRVLLASLPGAAVVGVKLAGADHEFMGLPGIQEDVLTMVLNLKKLRLKIFSDEICKLTLEASGQKVVTAADITPNSQVEIVNPDLVLANLTTKDANLTMEIFVSNGRGYEMVENRPKTKKEIGYIEIDSMYTPVMAAGLTVENVRVGNMVNWDKLILRILTDGTTSPRQAFTDANEILINQFAALSDLPETDDSSAIAGQQLEVDDESAEEISEVEEIVEEVKKPVKKAAVKKESADKPTKKPAKAKAK
ncbi:DNA-directed RNA polymerase subunit alpha [Candidatus Falkowbacteria bacterium]|nr:DNA-directed RNA polymerase subunit alpha [Candidatus Falkowbacteria bacterium]